MTSNRSPNHSHQIPGASAPTRYWHSLNNEQVQCDLCPRACHLREGQRGLCYARGCENGEVVLHSWGRSSGFCIDPIEKKPLNHFLPGTPVLSFGTAGCNLACKFCQNWDISKSRETDRLLASATPEALAAAALEHGCRSVAFTYNDPVIFMEYALDVATACREQGIAAVAVTAGYICDQPRRDFFQSMDAANVDLKAFSQRFYRHLCGGDLSTVLDTLLFLRHESNTWFEITTLLIPDENDSNAEIEAMCQWIHTNLGDQIPLHFSAFHPDWKLTNRQPTPASSLTRARAIARTTGLNYVYTGNVHDAEGGSTWCHQCGALLIERDWYQLGHWGLNADGDCQKCGCRLPGRFEEQPGRWGARRQPVQLGLG